MRSRFSAASWLVVLAVMALRVVRLSGHPLVALVAVAVVIAVMLVAALGRGGVLAVLLVVTPILLYVVMGPGPDDLIRWWVWGTPYDVRVR